MDTSPPQTDAQVDKYRSYLLLLARLQVDGRQCADASDIVQQTLLEAHQKRSRFKGGEQAMAAWLRKILANNLRDAFKARARAKRDPAREQPLDGALDASSDRLAAWLAGTQPSPSSDAVRNEMLARLADALLSLGDAQREAIITYHLKGATLKETAARLGKSDTAVAGLLHRGLQRLKALMGESKSSDAAPPR
jgi:RNA polymerase sigma-70 factor (ECF subfamily)